MSWRANANIDLTALQHNLNVVRSKVKARSILAMIKSNAYGHGLIQVASALNQADAFGVATLAEAELLRDAGINHPIVVMSGFFSASELPYFVNQNLTAVIHHDWQIDILQKTPGIKPLNVWLKIDTGMHRLGFSKEVAESAHKRLHHLEWVNRPIAVMTHLADAENKDQSFTHQQLNDFFKLTSQLPGPTSIANSAAILAIRDSWADWVRPGIMLYGVSPFTGRVGEDEGLRPVMTLSSRIIAIKSLKRGDRIGYNGVWQCPEDMPVGVVAMGYGDGYPRHARCNTPTLVNGVVCPLVGRVSMDLLTIDLRPNPKATVGDEVILWGKGLPVETIADYSDTIAYELLCNLTSRVEQLVDSGSPRSRG